MRINDSPITTMFVTALLMSFLANHQTVVGENPLIHLSLDAVGSGSHL
jgi:hypothetical protein